MDNKQTYPQTKEAALAVLGVVAKKTLKKLAADVEFVTVNAGRRLLSRGAFTPTVLVGVAGAVTVRADDGPVVYVEAPFAIDFWAADDRRVSNVSVVSSVETALVLVDWNRRQGVFEAIPALSDLSDATRSASSADSTEAVLDLTEVVSAQPDAEEVPAFG